MPEVKRKLMFTVVRAAQSRLGGHKALARGTMQWHGSEHHRHLCRTLCVVVRTLVSFQHLASLSSNRILQLFSEFNPTLPDMPRLPTSRCPRHQLPQATKAHKKHCVPSATASCSQRSCCFRRTHPVQELNNNGCSKASMTLKGLRTTARRTFNYCIACLYKRD